MPIRKKQYHLIRKNQTGAALVVSLMILLAVTIIGIASMRSSMMEEKITANLRDKELSWQASNMALREPESWMNAQLDPANVLDDKSEGKLCTSSGCSNSVQVWEPGSKDWSDAATVAAWWGSYADMDGSYNKDPIIYGTDGSATGTNIAYCGDAAKTYKRTYGFNDGVDENNCIPQVGLPPTYIIEAFPHAQVTNADVKYDCVLKTDDFYYRITSKGFGVRQTTSSTVRSYYLKKC